MSQNAAAVHKANLLFLYNNNPFHKGPLWVEACSINSIICSFLKAPVSLYPLFILQTLAQKGEMLRVREKCSELFIFRRSTDPETNRI